MKFPDKIEQQINRYQKDQETANEDQFLRLEGKIEGLKSALMYYHSMDSHGNVTHKPGRLGITEEH
jgi:hypothetical protein